MSPELIKQLAVAWRNKGLNLASLYPGQGGDLVKQTLDTCAEELEEWAGIPVVKNSFATEPKGESK